MLSSSRHIAVNELMLIHHGNVPFVVTRSLVSATIDMGVGHGCLVKLCRHLDMNVMNSTTYSSHVKEVAYYANKVAVTTILDEAVTVIRQTHSGHAHRRRRRHRLGCQLRWQFDDERTQGIVWDWVCGGYHH